MDDLYAINAAKTEFREGFNMADASRILAIADPDLVNFSDGQPSEFGETGLDALKTRQAALANLSCSCCQPIHDSILFWSDQLVCRLS
jgi:ketosteroid isomerase-like protein